MKKQRTVMALLVGALIFTLCSGVPVQAEIYKLSVGAGPGLVPQYDGSNEYAATPMLFAEAVWNSGRYVRLDGSKLRANVLTHDMFRLGPVANYRLGRDDFIDVDDNIVKKMEKVDDSFELGAFAGVQIDNLTFMLEALSDVSDGHDGTIVTLSGKYTWRVNDPWTLFVGVLWSWVDSDYMSSFFDVNAKDSARSGLERYSTDDGFKDVGFNLGANYILTDHWSVLASGSYRGLLGDAHDSPVVDDQGDSTQFSLGVRAVYTF